MDKTKPAGLLRRTVFLLGCGVFAILCAGLLSAIGLFISHDVGASSGCTIYWNGKTNTNWSTASNWTLTDGSTTASPRVPSSTDVACLSTSVTNFTSEVSGSETVAGLIWPAVTSEPASTIDVNGGNLTVGTGSGSTAVASNVDVVDNNDGYFGGSSTVSIGTLHLSNTGWEDGSGTQTVQAGTVSATDDSDDIVGITLINQGTFTVAASSSIDLSNSATFQNDGTVDLTTSSVINGDASETVANDADGTIAFAGSSTSSIGSIYPTLIDLGTMSATEGALVYDGTGTIGPDAVNSDLTKGTVELGDDAVISAYNGASGGTGNIGGLTNNDGYFSGPGTLDIPSGQTTTFQDDAWIEGNASIEVEQGGTLNIPLGQQLIFSGASTVTNDGTIAIASNASTDGNDALQDDDQSGNSLINNADGSIVYTATATTQQVYASVPITNAGTISDAYGTMILTGQLTLDSTADAATTNGGIVEAEAAVQADQSQNGSLDGLTIGDDGILSAASGAGNLVVDADNTVTCDQGELDGATVVNNGTFVVPTNSTCYFDAAGKLQNSGMISLSNGSYLNNDDDTANLITNESAGLIQFTAQNNTQTATISVPTTNDGTLTILGEGILQYETTTSNLSTGGALSNGTWDITGSLQINGDYPSDADTPTFTSNSASLTLGVASSITSDGEASFSTLASNSGAIALGSSISDSHALTNTGVISITAGTLEASSYTQAGTSSSSTAVGTGTTLKAGTSGTGTVKVSGGELAGFGTVEGAVTNASGGTVTAEIATGGGPLSISGSYTAQTGSTTGVQVAGNTTAGVDFGQLAVSGKATFGGTLSLSVLVSYAPTAGTTIPIVTAGSTAGFFSAVTGGTRSGLAFSASYSSSGASIVNATTIPTVHSLSPNKIARSVSGKSVTITGSGFSSPATVRSSVSGVTFSSVTVKSATQITAKVTVTSSATLGSGAVLVSDTGQGSGSCSSCLVVDAPPTIKKLSPSSAAQGKTVTVKITGTGFASGATIAISGSGLTIKVSKVTSTTITISVKVSSSAKKGSRSVTITNTDGGTVTKKTGLKIT